MGVNYIFQKKGKKQQGDTIELNYVFHLAYCAKDDSSLSGLGLVLSGTLILCSPCDKVKLSFVLLACYKYLHKGEEKKINFMYIIGREKKNLSYSFLSVFLLIRVIFCEVLSGKSLS